MSPTQKRRLALVIFLVAGLGAGITLVLLALNENINLFFTPTQVAAGEVAAPQRRFQVGGLVLPGSVAREENNTTTRFTLTDLRAQVPVEYSGILPDLFREGQGIVAEGVLNEQGVFIAQRVLAKHDENYMPPHVAESLEPGYRPAERPR